MYPGCLTPKLGNYVMSKEERIHYRLRINGFSQVQNHLKCVSCFLESKEAAVKMKTKAASIDLKAPHYQPGYEIKLGQPLLKSRASIFAQRLLVYYLCK